MAKHVDADKSSDKICLYMNAVRDIQIIQIVQDVLVEHAVNQVTNSGEASSRLA